MRADFCRNIGVCKDKSVQNRMNNQQAKGNHKPFVIYNNFVFYAKEANQQHI